MDVSEIKQDDNTGKDVNEVTEVTENEVIKKEVTKNCEDKELGNKVIEKQVKAPPIFVHEINYII
jgi:hypothetical protein